MKMVMIQKFRKLGIKILTTGLITEDKQLSLCDDISFVIGNNEKDIPVLPNGDRKNIGKLQHLGDEVLDLYSELCDEILSNASKIIPLLNPIETSEQLIENLYQLQMGQFPFYWAKRFYFNN